MDIYGFDIETDTTINGLDPRVSKVVSMALYSPNYSIVIDGGTEVERLARLAEVAANLPRGSLIATWNGSVFDFPFLATRALITGVRLGIEMQADPGITPKYEFTPPHTSGYRVRFAGHPHADIAYAYQEYAATVGVTWSLKPVCAALGIEMVKVDASKIHELSSEELAVYNMSDVRGTHQAAELLGTSLDLYVDEIEHVTLVA